MRVDGIEEEAQRFMFEVTLNEPQGSFELGRADLPDAARARIDQLVGQIQADPQNVYFEIEGHTDSTGSERRNMQLGMQRAEMVKIYLYDQHNVPLHRISVLSFGEESPGGTERHRGRAGAEPPRRDPGPTVTRASAGAPSISARSASSPSRSSMSCIRRAFGCARLLHGGCFAGSPLVYH